MPCNDVTEVISLQLDPEDRIRHYTLNKLTCGRAVGEQTLLLAHVEGLLLQEFLSLSLDAFFQDLQSPSEEEEYLALKHYFALQLVALVLTGGESGGIQDQCTVESIGYDSNGTEIVAQISQEVLTEKIKSCGRCAGCGTKKLAAAASGFR
jgi:hypothetical protein